MSILLAAVTHGVNLPWELARVFVAAVAAHFAAALYWFSPVASVWYEMKYSESFETAKKRMADRRESPGSPMPYIIALSCSFIISLFMVAYVLPYSKIRVHNIAQAWWLAARFIAFLGLVQFTVRVFEMDKPSKLLAFFLDLTGQAVPIFTILTTLVLMK